jgi:glycerophosphoryl diester phosphodiesterase
LPPLPFPDFYSHRPLNFAHRGARAQAPENTLPAFERAVTLHADGIELDVQLTADHQIVVYHDEKLGRTSEGQGRIAKWRLEALKELDAGRHFSDQFAGTRIPTLAEVFEAVGQRLLINVEIKPFVRRPVIMPMLIQMIRHYGMQNRVMVSSFNPWILRAMRRQAPDIARGFLIDQDGPLLLRYDFLLKRLIGTYHARHPHFSDANSSYVEWAHTKGYRVNVWTVNQITDIRRMIELGVDMIISDVPDVVHSVLEQDSR